MLKEFKDMLKAIKDWAKSTFQPKGDYALVDNTGYSLGLNIDKDYIMTLELKNSKGNVLSTKNIDFPIESMVIGADYAGGVITLSLQNGDTLDVDVSALVNGLVNDAFTIAGIDMKDDITKAELATALGINEIESDISDLSDLIDNVTNTLEEEIGKNQEDISDLQSNKASADDLANLIDDVNKRFATSGTSFNSTSDFPSSGSAFGVCNNVNGLTLYDGFTIPVYSRIIYINYGTSDDAALIAVDSVSNVYSAFRNGGNWGNGKIISADSYVSKSGDKMTGNLTLDEGVYLTGETSQTSRPEYHAIKIGSPNNDQLDFYEYAGLFNFYKTGGNDNRLVAEISPTRIAHFGENFSAMSVNLENGLGLALIAEGETSGIYSNVLANYVLQITKNGSVILRGLASYSNAIISQGNMSSDVVYPGANGLSVAEAYNNGYPYPYGNILTIAGNVGGQSQLLLGWAPSNEGIAPVYYRNKRDMAAAYSPFCRLLMSPDDGSNPVALYDYGEYHMQVGCDYIKSVCDSIPYLRLVAETSSVDNHNHNALIIYGGSFYGYNAIQNGTIDTMSLGTATYKWTQLYANNGTIQTSDLNEKNTIKDLSPERAKDFIMAQRAVTYKMNNGESGRTHWGMISQYVEEALKKLGMDSLDFAGFIKSPKKRMWEEDEEYETTDKETGETITKTRKVRKEELIEDEYDYSLRYDEFISPIIAMEQYLYERIKEQDEKIGELEAKIKEQDDEIKQLKNDRDKLNDRVTLLEQKIQQLLSA